MDLAFYLIILGVVLLVGVYLLLRQHQRTDPTAQRTPLAVVPVHLSSASDAVVMASGYGRIVFANDLARQWFGMNGGDPNLEMMAAQAHPPDIFRELFADEGRAAFQLGGRRVEASSHWLPGGTERQMIVVLREMGGQRADHELDPGRTMAVLNQIGQICSADYSLPDMLNAVLENLTRAIPHDAGIVCLAEEDTEALRPLARRGDPAYLRALENVGGVYQKGEGYSGWVATYRQSLLIEDVDVRSDLKLWGDSVVPFRSYVGVPLLAGDRFIGTLELVNSQASAFNYEALALLEAIASQVAVAVEKVRFQREQLDRITELTGVQKIAQAMSALGNRHQLFDQLSTQMARLMSVELCGFLLHDPDQDVLVSQSPFFGIPDTVIDTYRMPLPPGSVARSLWEGDGWFSNRVRDEDLASEIGLLNTYDITEERTVAFIDVLGIRTMALAPVEVGGRRIGLLQISNKRSGADLGPEDLKQLAVFAMQSAVVIESARLFEGQQRRTEEFLALQQIAQSIGSAAEFGNLTAQVTARIASLLNVEMCGILLYEAGHQALIGLSPFFGVDQQLLDYMQIPAPAGSAMAHRWQEGDAWFSNDLSRDPLAAQLGLDQLTTWVGVTQMLIAPLSVGGRRVGVMFLGNKHGGQFSNDDAQMLAVCASQLAASMENNRLQHELDAHQGESRALRRVSEIAGSPLPLDDLIRHVLEETAALFDSPVAAVDLLDSTGHLRVEPAHVVGVTLSAPLSADSYSGGFERTVVFSGQPLLSNDMIADTRTIEAYRPVVKALNLRRAVVVPLSVGGRGSGELIIGNRPDESYTEHDLETLFSVAVPLSAALERARLRDTASPDALDAYQSELAALSRVSDELNLTVDLDRVLNVIRQEALRVLGGSGGAEGSVLLLSPHDEWSKFDQAEMMRRHGAEQVLAEGAPIERWAMQTMRTVRVENYAESDDLQAVPLGAASALAAPILYDGQAVGVIHLFHTVSGAFDERAESFINRLAFKAATAYGNATRFHEQVSSNLALIHRVEQLSQIFELGQALRSETRLEGVLEAVAHAVQLSLGFSAVILSLLDEQGRRFRRVAQAGIPLLEFQEMQRVIIPRVQVEKLFVDAFRISESYLLPAERVNEWQADIPNEQFHYQAEYATSERANAWKPDDVLIVPLRDSQGKLMGIMTVDAPISGQRPSRPTVETLEIFAHQAAISIENFYLVQAMQREAESARRERDLLERLYRVSSEIQQVVDVPARLQIVAKAIQDAGWRRVHITLRDENLSPTALIQVGYDGDEAADLQTHLVPGEEWRKRLADPEFLQLRLGTAYYLRYDAPWVMKHLWGMDSYLETAPMPVGKDRWHPQDQLYLPIYGANNRLIGLIGMDRPIDNFAPTADSLRPIELFANQAANVIEMTRLYIESVRAAEQESRLNEMMEAVASTLDIRTIVQAVADGLQRLMPFTRMTVGLYNQGRDSFDTLQVRFVGISEVEVLPGRPLAVENTAMGLAMHENKAQVYFIDEMETSLADLQTWRRQGEATVLIAPMIAGGRTVGALRLGSQLSHAFGFGDNMPLVQRMTNLAAVAIQNARLFLETRDLQSFTGAVVESIGQGIVVLDRGGRIVTINAFMREKYGWSDEGLNQLLFDYRPHYADILTEGLESVLQEGKPWSNVGVPGETRDGLPVVRNFYLYPLEEGDDVTGVVLLVEDITAKATLEADLRVRAAQLTALTEVSNRMTATLQSDEVVQLVLDQLERVVPYDGVALWLREGDNLRIAAARGYQGGAAELVGLSVAIEDSALFREMADRRSTLNVPDVTQDNRFFGAAERPTLSWLGAPLIRENQIIGLLTLDKVEAGYYHEHHEQLAQAFANQAAVALENARLFTETHRRANELSRQTESLGLLNRVSIMLAQSLDVENTLEVALHESAQALGAKSAQAVLFEPDQQIGIVMVELPRGETPPSETFQLQGNPAVDYVRRTLQPLIVEDALNDPMLQPLREALEERNVVSLAMVPLSVSGQVIGVLILESIGEAHDFAAEQVELAQTIATQAAIAVQNANLFEQSVIRTRELETLFEASQATALTLDLEEVIRSVGQQMIHALEADGCSVMMWDEVENQLLVYSDVNRQDDPALADPPGGAYPLNEFPARKRSLERREVLIIRREDDDSEPSEKQDMEAHGSITRMLVPLVVREQAIGLVKVELRDSFRAFSFSEQRIARTLAGQAAVAIENARLNSETARQLEELFTINDLSRRVSAAMNMDELLPIIRTQVTSLTRADWLYLALYDADTGLLNFPVVVHLGQGVDMPSRLMGSDEFSWIMRFKRPLMVLGQELEEVRRNLGIETMLPPVRSFLGVPLEVGGQVAGALAISDDDNPRAFGLNDQRILLTVAGQLAVTLQNARLFDQLRDFADELEDRVEERTVELQAERDRLNTLYNITAELSATLDMDRLLTRALDVLANAVGAERGSVMLINRQDERLYNRAEMGQDTSTPSSRRGLRTTEGLAGWVIQHRQSVIVEDLQKDPRWLRLTPADELPHAALAVLLETVDDVQGVMLLFSTEPGKFKEEHLRLASAAANQLATSINNAELYLYIREQAERLGDMVHEQQIEASKSGAILDGVADGVMVSNEHGEVILFNPAAERILDLRRQDILGYPIGNFSGLYGGGGKQWIEAIESWMSDPTQLQGMHFLNETLDIGNGKMISVSLAPVHMADQFLGTVSVFRDITREVELDRMKTEFISNVSHELRTPMTSIKGYADLLILGAAGEISERQLGFLNTIKTNADRLTVLVNDLLNISRIDSGKVKLKLQPISLAQVARMVLTNLRGRIENEGKELEVVTEIDEDLPQTYGDFDKLTQVMTNLLDNAFQYTHAGGKITLKIRRETENSFLLSVTDSGIGIPDKFKHRVFDRFFRGEEQQLVMETPGTGLGLAIVKELVGMHGGRIWFESEENVGTTFYISLPLLTTQEAPQRVK